MVRQISSNNCLVSQTVGLRLWSCAFGVLLPLGAKVILEPHGEEDRQEDRKKHTAVFTN